MKRAVLIVEDDEIWRTLLAEVLRLEGFEVVIASDGYEALHLLRTGLLPLAVVLDLHLPRIDGWKFLELWAHGGPPPAPVCIASSVDRADAPPLGGVGKFLQKPIPLSELVSFVRDADRDGRAASRPPG